MDNKKINIFTILILGIFILLTLSDVIIQKTVSKDNTLENKFNIILSDNIKAKVKISDFLVNLKKTGTIYDGVFSEVQENDMGTTIHIFTKTFNEFISAINPELQAEIEKNGTSQSRAEDFKTRTGATTMDGVRFSYVEHLSFNQNYPNCILDMTFLPQPRNAIIYYSFVLLNILFIVLICIVLYAKVKEEKRFIIFIIIGVVWTIISFLINFAAGLGSMARGYPTGSPSLIGQLLFLPFTASFLIKAPLFSFQFWIANLLAIGAFIPVLFVMVVRKIKNL